MSMDYNQMKLDYLKEKQKIREEKEAYEEAFYKLSNKEQIIIRKVEGDLIQVDKMDRLNKYKLKLEQMKKEEIKREKKEIERLTKLIETDRVRNDQIKIISTATWFVGVLAYVGLTIITR